MATAVASTFGADSVFSISDHAGSSRTLPSPCIDAFIDRLKTEDVDVDSRGRPCKERMFTIRFRGVVVEAAVSDDAAVVSSAAAGCLLAAVSKPREGCGATAYLRCCADLRRINPAFHRTASLLDEGGGGLEPTCPPLSQSQSRSSERRVKGSQQKRNLWESSASLDDAYLRGILGIIRTYVATSGTATHYCDELLVGQLGELAGERL